MVSLIACVSGGVSTMVFWRVSVAVGLAVITALALLAVNASIQEERRELAGPFTQWVAAVHAVQRRAMLAEEPPSPLTVALDGTIGERAVAWQISVGGSAANVERLLRLLDLIRESKIMESRDGLPPCTGVLCLRAYDSTRRFESELSPLLVSENLALQNLLKLMEIYSRSTPEEALTGSN